MVDKDVVARGTHHITDSVPHLPRQINQFKVVPTSKDIINHTVIQHAN